MSDTTATDDATDARLDNATFAIDGNDQLHPDEFGALLRALDEGDVINVTAGKSRQSYNSDQGLTVQYAGLGRGWEHIAEYDDKSEAKAHAEDYGEPLDDDADNKDALMDAVAYIKADHGGAKGGRSVTTDDSLVSYVHVITGNDYDREGNPTVYSVNRLYLPLDAADANTHNYEVHVEGPRGGQYIIKETTDGKYVMSRVSGGRHGGDLLGTLMSFELVEAADGTDPVDWMTAALDTLPDADEDDQTIDVVVRGDLDTDTVRATLGDDEDTLVLTATTVRNDDGRNLTDTGREMYDKFGGWADPAYHALAFDSDYDTWVEAGHKEALKDGDYKTGYDDVQHRWTVDAEALDAALVDLLNDGMADITLPTDVARDHLDLDNARHEDADEDDDDDTDAEEATTDAQSDTTTETSEDTDNTEDDDTDDDTGPTPADLLDDVQQGDTITVTYLGKHEGNQLDNTGIVTFVDHDRLDREEMPLVFVNSNDKTRRLIVDQYDPDDLGIHANGGHAPFMGEVIDITIDERATVEDEDNLPADGASVEGRDYWLDPDGHPITQAEYEEKYADDEDDEDEGEDAEEDKPTLDPEDIDADRWTLLYTLPDDDEPEVAHLPSSGAVERFLGHDPKVDLHDVALPGEEPASRHALDTE